MHNNVFSHSFIDKRFAKIDKNVEDSGVVNNMDANEKNITHKFHILYNIYIYLILMYARPSHPNWKSSCQEVTKTSQFIDAKVPCQSLYDLMIVKR